MMQRTAALLLPLFLLGACVVPEGKETGPVPGPARPTAWTDLPPLAYDPPPYTLFLEGLKVCLDPGHGGDAHRKGYKRTKSGFREAVMNWRVAGLLKGFLEEAGAQVVLTREGDVEVSLARRAEIALEKECDIFVSLHHNACGKPAVNRTTVWYHGDDDWSPASLDAARCVYWGLSEHLRLKQIATVPLNSDLLMYKSGFGVLRGIQGKIPALLTESSFFTNPAEEARLRRSTYNKREAWGIFLGLARWAFHGLPRAVPLWRGPVGPEESLAVRLDSGLQQRKSWSAGRPHVIASSIGVFVDGKRCRDWTFAYPELEVKPPAGGWPQGEHALRVHFVNLFKNSPVNPDLVFRVGPPPGIRVDLLFYGGKEKTRVAVRGIHRIPCYGGPPLGSLAPDLGNWRAVLHRPGEEKPCWRAGVNSLLDEWRTLPASAGEERSFPFFLRLPAAAEKLRLTLQQREGNGEWRDFLSRSIEAGSDLPPLPRPLPAGHRLTLQEGGRPADSLDILLIGDGYPRGAEDTLAAHARRCVSLLLQSEPFRKQRDRIAVRVYAPYEAGEKEKRLCRYGGFGMARYLLPARPAAAAAIASRIPADLVVYLVNSPRFGGAGVFNNFATVSAGTMMSSRVLLHEMGHLLGGLADEYVGTVTYENPYAGIEPWEPNITRVTEAKTLKWRHLLTPDTPLPTPAVKTHARAVGLFEGAGYAKEGLYRPCLTCAMRSLSTPRYCPVCTAALARSLSWWLNGVGPQ